MPSWPVELAERVAAQPDDPGRARELESAVRRLAAGARPFDDLALEEPKGCATVLGAPAGSATLRYHDEYDA